MWGRSSTRTSVLSLAILAATGCGSQAVSETELTFAVASSLRNVMPELIRGYAEQQRGVEIIAAYGGSGTLRQQVAAGAPIDAVIFAGAPPVDQLVKSGHANADSRRVVATNTLVLIGASGAAPLRFESIERVPAGEKLAIGDPASVPVGTYAREALRALGKWDAIQDRLVFGGNVAVVLAYARRGEVAAAVVYKTDTIGVNDIVVLDEARGDWAPRPLVVAVVTSKTSVGVRANAFLDFVSSAAGREILTQHGFGRP